MPHPHHARHWLHWPRYLWHAGWRALDLDGIPSYRKRHERRLATLLLASIVLLAGWICAHRVVAPDIAARSLLWLGGGIIPHSLLVCLCLGRLKPSWREYAAMYGAGVAYVPIQILFSLSRSDAAPYLLAGTCFLFLILSNLMMRLRFGNAVVVSVFTTLAAVWLFARQAGGQGLMLCFAVCALAVAASTLYVNYVIGNDEMYYVRLEQHFRLVLSGGMRDLWEFDSATRVIRIQPWNADPSQPPVSCGLDEYVSLIHPEYRPELMRVIHDSLTGQAGRFHLEFQMRPAGQAEWRWLQLAGHADEHHAGGTATRLIGTSCDVTDRKSLHARAEQQSRDFQQAAQEKAEFLARMSHSIRTPLNAVIGATSVLATDDLHGEAREMVDTIQRSGMLLLTVLNDVLDLTPWSSTRPQLEPVSFNPHQLLRHCCELIGPLARRKNLELRLRAAPEMRSHLSGDAVRLQQVLINLLSNAVKFTNSGSVCLSTSVEATSDPAAQAITFSVRDTGIGIEEHAQRSLFERFEQVHVQTVAGPAGSGLGLAISQRLVGAMGGVIRCQSQAGSGSTFSSILQFPVLAAGRSGAGDSAASAGAAAAYPVKALPVRVLVAEDNPVNQRVLAGMLQRLNCEVQLAANGADAVEACRQGSFDVIFMDCDMPVLNGLEATRHIRRLPEFAAVPIIASTAHALPENLEACRKAGMSDTLTKPVTLPSLTAALTQWAAGPGPACAKRSG